MKQDARRQLEDATAAVQAAVNLLRFAMPTMEALLKEVRDMENFGHIVDPTLYRDPERKAVSALITPVFQSAVNFVGVFDVQAKLGGETLAKVMEPAEAAETWPTI